MEKVYKNASNLMVNPRGIVRVVRVKGNVDGYLCARRESEVAIKGSVQRYVRVKNKSEVTVEGDVKGGLVLHSDSKLRLGGELSGRIKTYPGEVGKIKKIEN